jgi:ferric-dicitrate binding protein FerR (iron transport regulator)
MNLIRRFLWSLGGWFSPVRGDDPALSRVDELLERRSASVRETDPETGRMWQRLKAELESEPRSVEARLRAVSVRLIKPAIAFAIVVVLMLASEVWIRHPAATTYTTSRGEHATVSLPDSSLVTLNHTSALTVDPARGEKTRRVSLKGEAFFRVRQDGTPFVVSTALGSVSVLGTEFNVLVRDDRLEVAVLSGTVRLSAERSGRDSSVLLSAGEIAACTGAGFPETPAPIPFPGYPGWMNGRFVFYRTSLLSACREIESQFAVVVKLGNPRLNEETITGSVDNSSVESALSALARVTGNRYRYENGVYIVY